MVYRPKNVQERIAHRLKIARGHLDKVIQMVETDEYCIDVIHQSQAVQRALEEADNTLLEHHLKTCVAKSIEKRKAEEAIEEIMSITRKGQR